MKKIILFIVSLLPVLAGLKAKNIYYVTENGTGNGTSWSNAAGNIQNMIDNAAADDEIWVAAGIYYPTRQPDEADEMSKTFLLKDGVNLYGGFAGNESSIDSRAKSDKDENGTIEAWEFSNETILSGNIDGITDVWEIVSLGSDLWRWKVSGANGNCKRVVTCNADVTGETRFDGFTVRGGDGGIYTYGNTIIQNCIACYNIDNRGIYNEIGTVTGCYIYRNARAGIGNIKGTVSNCTVDNNSNFSTMIANAGGGIVNEEGEIINCTVTNNCAVTFYTSSNSPVANQACYGGGIYNITGKIDRCIVANNSAYAYSSATGGGMMYTLAYGGGIYSQSGMISNCCVFNNKVTADSNRGSNYAYPLGGGISCGNIGSNNYEKVLIYNTTMAKNGGAGNNSNYNSGGTDYNCITTASDLQEIYMRPTSFTGTATTVQQMEELLQADWRLKSGSEPIDAGVIDNLPDWIVNGVDLAGNPRINNGKIDLGAYEYYPESGVKGLLRPGITISSSPVNDFVTVSGLLGNETFRFHTISGASLFTHKATGETEIIPVSHLPAGLYLINIQTGENISTHKFIKK
jgi:hypothetical protein